MFKFVIAASDDLAEVLSLQQTHAIPSQRIWLMPEGRDSDTLQVRSRWLAQICSEHEFNLSDRLHIHLYGDTRGT
jgi:organic radical activating enzyme